MYRNEKEALLELCGSMPDAHRALVGSREGTDERAELCEICQQTAIRIGESLENEDKEQYAAAIHRLEEYCEIIFRLSGKEKIDENDTGEPDSIAGETSEVLASIKPRLKVVFFPYKAEMWDSLESFYIAAREDPECDAYLVPIPYFEYDKRTEKMVSRYDGSRFPADEEPIPFNKFDHRDGSIDIAYIHNPYDEYNLVTSVHPDYYSSELRKYVRKLVYTPYYVTAGFMSDDQLALPVYDNVDYVVLQGEATKEECAGRPYYDKILPFGSSKLDMIIRKCSRGVKPPAEWESVIAGRRTLMLNTSINDLLGSNEAILGKLEYFFDLIKNNDRLAVIWRPHPLLESTLRAMRPEMLERYEGLKETFISEGVGVLDETPDISDTVAIADGYIGSGASSVINLFGAAGKPIFIFNNALREPVSEADRRVMQLTGMAYFRGRYYMRPVNLNGIFSLSASDPKSGLKYEGSVPGITNWTTSLNGFAKAGERIYMAPLFADDAMSYDPVMKEVETLGCEGRKFDIRLPGMGIPLPSEKSIFFLPVNERRKNLIAEYIPSKKEWLYDGESLPMLYDGVERPNYIPVWCGGARYDDVIYYSTGVCNRILRLESGTGGRSLICIGKEELTNKYPVILKGASKEGLWFSMFGRTEIYMAAWDGLLSPDSWKVIEMPESMDYTHDDWGDFYGFNGGMAEFGEYMIVYPYRAPHMMRINKKTFEIEFIAEDFFKDSDKKGIGYELKHNGICGAACLVGNDRVAVQRNRDLHVAVINVFDGSYEEFIPEIPEEMFDKLVPEDGGFFKGDKYDYFRMSESRLFPLEHFLEVFSRDGYKEVKKEQLKALSTFAANLDGTCGVKTHDFLKRDIFRMVRKNVK